MKAFTLAALADQFNLALENCSQPDTIVSGVGTLQSAGEGKITFLENKSYQKYLPDTKATAVILSEQHKSASKIPVLISPNPYATYARIAELFNHRSMPEKGIHSTAVVGKNCEIHESARIGAYCVIGDDCKIGADSCLFPHVTLYDEVILGSRVMIHSGAVIGSDGFGNAHTGTHWLKVPQLGRTVIGSDVEIGANTTVDRGALDDTVIEDGVRLDNLIQIAHNVRIGAHTAIAAGVAIAGSTKIGRYCMIGGATSISGHLEICDQTIIGGMSAVIKSIKQPGVYAGPPVAFKKLDWQKMTVRMRHLQDLFQRVENLEKRLKEADGHS
jgi:UDP-3-O-[3-hydroxymyristoyl] glucosamine N-acyltransferase